MQCHVGILQRLPLYQQLPLSDNPLNRFGDVIADGVDQKSLLFEKRPFIEGWQFLPVMNLNQSFLLPENHKWHLLLPVGCLKVTRLICLLFKKYPGTGLLRILPGSREKLDRPLQHRLDRILVLLDQSSQTVATFERRYANA